MRAVDVRWHFAGVQIVIDARAAWSKAHKRNAVRGFGKHVNEIVSIWLSLGPGLPGDLRRANQGRDKSGKERA